MTEQSEKIAIIGMACRFPGANTTDQFWQNLRNGKSSITQFSRDQLIANGVPENIIDDPDYVKSGAWLDHADCFDAAFFAYNPREALMMDPQQRVFLECAYAALEDASIVPSETNEIVGVYGGIARNTYQLNHYISDLDSAAASGDYQSMIASEKDFLASRVAFKLNLSGPAINVQTACSSSGVAIHLAIQGLLAGDTTVALAGGGRILAPLHTGYWYEEGGTQSPDGHCRAFDAQAKGMVRGSGMGMIALKRLDDAIRDGDHIHAVIRASAINNDGSEKIGFTAPSVHGQAAVIGDALAISDTNPEEIGYVEAHGTGTALGDPIEISALTRAYREFTNKEAYCPVGSVKSNIGHLDAGATIASIIKCVLILKHGEIPPTVDFKTPNPEIDFKHSPFFVNAETIQWPTQTSIKCVAVSSFGLGGTNFHAILEEWKPTLAQHVGRPWALLPISTKSETTLNQASANISEYCTQQGAANIADVAFTLQTAREKFNHRSFAVINNTTDPSASNGQNAEIVWASTTVSDKKETKHIFMFTGQGAQYVNMGRGLYENEPVYREQMDHCFAFLQNTLNINLKSILYPTMENEKTASETLSKTRYTQPALFVTEYALAKLWMSWGIQPHAMIGHSIGEYVAACLSGVFSLEQTLQLVNARGELMQSMPPGSMLAVSLPADEVQAYLSGSIGIATINTQANTVLSGPDAEIQALEKTLNEKDITCRTLHTSHAFHSSMMDGMLDEFENIVSQCSPQKPTLPFISNLTGDWITDDEACDTGYWAKHLRNTVKYFDGIGKLLHSSDSTFIEIGPGRTLSNFTLQHPDCQSEHAVISSLHPPKDHTPDQQYLFQALGQAWATGTNPDWSAFYHYEQRQRIPVPTYPFARTAYWYDDNSPHQRQAALADDTQETNSETTNAESNEHTVLQDTQQLLSEMSGLDVQQINPQATFLELGLDSLALTQVCLTIKKRFSVTVSFRQIMEELSSANELSAFIENHKPEANSSSSPTQVHSPGTSASTTATVTTGPWKAIDKSNASALSGKQQQHIATLIEKIVEKSPKSKALTQHNRSRLADARTISGFRKIWKELVYPIVTEHTAGTRIYDIDGNEFTDIAMGFGVNLFGLSPEFVTHAVQQQLQTGYDIGPQTPLAGEVATLFCEMTGQERAAFCNTGSEAVLAAIRIARTVTARDKIVIFAGSYHGIFDEVLVKNMTANGQSRSVPVAPGILPQMVQQVIVLNYGDEQAFEEIRRQHTDIAAVLVEPVQSRHPDLQPFEFLRQLRTVTEELDIALVFDEMVTGFRSHAGGVQALADVKADIATYGKVIGGGLPIGIVGGKAKYLDALDGGMWQYGDESIPEVGVTWFAGTFVRHPLALAAAKAVLLHLKEKGPTLQKTLTERTQTFVDFLNKTLIEIGAPIHVETFSSFFHIKFKSHQEYSTLLYLHMREKGFYITEGRSSFFSTAHSEADFNAIASAIIECVKELQTAGFLPSARTVSENTRTDTTSITISAQSLTASQMEIWLACHLGDDASCAYNLSNTFTFDGELNQQILEASIVRLINNHDSLRMTISKSGEPHYASAVNDSGLEVSDLSTLNKTKQDTTLTDAATEEVETPYDFISGPLIRTRLFKLSDSKHILFLSVHHVACDGWSIGILMHELGEIYSALVQGNTDDSAPALQYSKYAAWLQKEEQKNKSATDEKYWQSIHKIAAPNLELPTDYKRPALKSFRANRLSRTLDDSISAKLPRKASQQKVTLFSYLLTSFNALLHTLTGQNDFTIGISAAGQTQIEGKNLVGHCVNFLPLRIKINEGNTFSETLKQTQNMVLEAYEHQFCTIGTLIKQLDLPHDPSRLPLISAAFNIDKLSDCDNFHGLSTDIGSNPRHFEAFDIFFNVVIYKDNITLECTFNSGIFSDSTIKHWLDLYTNILQSSLASDDDKNISALSNDEEELILRKWNQTKRSYNNELCLHELISQQCANTPGRTAVIDNHTQLKYGELDSRANQLANYLRESGVGPNIMVGVSLTRSHKMLVAIIAILKAGGAYVPLDPNFPPDRLTFMLEDSGINLLVTESGVHFQSPDSKIKNILIDQDSEIISKKKKTPPKKLGNSDDLAYVIYTSGSTGRPKGVLVTHKNIVNFILSMKNDIKVGASDVFIALTTLSFDIATLELYLPLAVGARVVIAEKEDSNSGHELLKLITRHNPTVIQATPATWRLLIASDWHGSDNLKILCGGEVLSADLATDLKKRAKTVWNMYGPTETTVWSTIYELNGDENILVGKPIANTTTYVLDEFLNPVPIGVPGELYIGGNGVTNGYHNRPELTAERFIENPFSDDPQSVLYKTGDAVKYHPDGNIEYINRIDFQVKIRGYRIELGEIESVLQQHESVKQTVAIVREDQPGDQRLTIYYILDIPGQQNSGDLRSFMGQSLPDYMVPQLFIELEEFPLGTSGKLDRKALPKPQTEVEISIEGLPETDLEKKLASIWKKFLGINSISVYDNFFELGGHSLLAVNMAIQIKNEIGIDIEFRSLVTDNLAQISAEYEKYLDPVTDVSTKEKTGVFSWIKRLTQK